MILVTGAAGFIGYQTCKYLIERGEIVYGIDNYSTGSPFLINLLRKNATFKFSKVSIVNYQGLEKIFINHQITAVMHFGALPRVSYSFDYPKETTTVNIQGTLNLLILCQKFLIKKFIFASSSSVYGNQEFYPLDESMLPNPMSPYGIQKFTCEKYCQFFFEVYKVPIIIFRYFNVYGDSTSKINKYSCFLPKIIDQLKNGVTPIIFGDGKQARDFTHILDVVNANYIAIKSKNENLFGEIFNIGFGMPISILSVADLVQVALNTNIRYTRLELKYAEPNITWANNNKAKEILGWRPNISFIDGLGLYLEDINTRSRLLP
jgi:nucleoside-diphosphate-sugar epimerase